MKLVYALWRDTDLDPDDFAKTLLGELAVARATLALRRVQVNVADSAVEDAMLRLTTFSQPVDAVVSVWTEGDDAPLPALAEVLGGLAPSVAGWQVTERVPLEPPSVPVGERTPGLANVAFLRRPPGLEYDAWLDRWQNRHTPIAIETQDTSGYVQNTVVRPVTDDAPAVDAIVEELFPIRALTDLHAFYGSGGDQAELDRRMTVMLQSVGSFGADTNIDVVPTSRFFA